MPDQTSAPFDPRAYCSDDEEYRLTDAQLAVAAIAPGRWTRPLVREVIDLRARVTELEQAATLAAACRPPEIHDRPTDTDLAALVRALEGTGDPAYVLGAELIEKRARVTELEDQVAFLADAEMERARLSLYARNARRTIRAVFESRRHWQDRTAGLEAERDKGYRDRAEVVAVLASIFPSQMADQDPETPGWPLLFLDTPEGQLSWHINPSDLDLFNTERYALALDEDPAAAPVWDGHTNEQKSARLHRLATCYQPADFLVDQHEVDVLRARVAELEDDHARLVEDVASTVRRFSATLDERDALRARLAELAAQQVYREVWSDEVAPGGMVCSICGHPVESEPCPTHAPDGYVVGWKYDGQLHIAYDEAEPSYATAGEARVVAAECCCEDPNTEFRVYELREVVAE
ncbi:hypothetical protein IU438_28745 [Nocardia cyriacigeorgica]|uniref:hypothetical protein n=1 Tax=Nocardia cyriacigeorgica TaxID=135487 RepID=UPI001895F834|nr:hypothetical protein [Nocardia cyriacigeorgica]MBF6399761.1 hypothetical protein [Nocardia cyriacigeorgica]MBF6405410.1 hypothetical protein [Nocardia cyriacigeorgica]